MADTGLLNRPAVSALGYWLLRYRRTWRGTIVISVANPLLFLAALGFGLGKLVDANHSAYLHGAAYLDFLAPGLIAAAMMQTAYLSASGPVRMSALPNGNYRAAITTPLDPEDLFAGHLLFMAFRIFTSAAAFVLVAACFGAIGPGRVVQVVVAALLTGLAFAAPVAAWAVGVDRPSAVNGCFRFVIMPMYMFCGTFFAPGQLPGWLRGIVACTPLYQGVQLTRGLSLGTASAAATAGHVGYLCALVAAGVWAGRRRYRRVLTR